jgi:arylsulfatase A-like enzyme
MPRTQLYDEVTHVLLLLWGAGVPAGKRAAEPVGHSDLLPTTLDLTGLPITAQATGISLDGRLVGKDAKFE